MSYERKGPLPSLEDRFENFYVRYDVHVHDGRALSLTADVWEVPEWATDGKPIFYNGGPNAPMMDATKAEPLFELHTKWDGCSHLRMPYLHFDTLGEFDAFRRCVEYIYDDVCARHGM